MKELIEIFRMKELHPDLRISLIKKLGRAINNELAMNLTEEVVYELTYLLKREKLNEYSCGNDPELRQSKLSELRSKYEANEEL